MEHNEAVQQMATERYLLGELSPAERDAFEEHLFDCADCTLDLRAGAAFVESLKTELPGILEESNAKGSARVAAQAPQRRNWFGWLTPAFAAPVFALLLAVIGYQNLSTIPGLRAEARTPRLVPWSTLHAGTRALGPVTLPADPHSGALLLLDLPQESEYALFGLQLTDPQGKPFWSATTAAGKDGAPVSVLLPAAGLQTGDYTLTILGITAQGSRTPLDRRTLHIQLP